MTDKNTPNQDNANPVDAPANPEVAPVETVAETTVTNPVPEAEPIIDYEKKFSESSREAQRLLEESRRKDEEIERLRKEREQILHVGEDNLYPGFEDLDEEQKKNLIQYTNVITNNVKKELYQIPEIAFARKAFNEQKWDSAFEKIASKYPELKSNKEDFRSKYFKPDNVPSNIENILEDVSKIYLFDKAKEIGAQEEREKASRIDIERAGGGDKPKVTSRSLKEWQALQESNPAEFAKRAKEYQEDLASGRLK